MDGNARKTREDEFSCSLGDAVTERDFLEGVDKASFCQQVDDLLQVVNTDVVNHSWITQHCFDSTCGIAGSVVDDCRHYEPFEGGSVTIWSRTTWVKGLH
mgnify:CR=1 FL=1